MPISSSPRNIEGNKPAGQEVIARKMRSGIWWFAWPPRTAGNINWFNADEIFGDHQFLTASVSK